MFTDNQQMKFFSGKNLGIIKFSTALHKKMWFANNPRGIF